MTFQKYLFILVFSTLTCALFAQEQWGLRLSNYGGINSTILNPAYHNTTPFSWDVNLVEGAAHFSNNYAYLRETNLRTILQNRENLNIDLAENFTEGAVPPSNTLLVDFYNDDRDRSMYSLVSVLGPSFYIRLGSNHSIGLVTRARAMTTTRGIDNNFSYYRYDPRPFFEDISIDKFRVASAAWSEIGLNYSYSTFTDNGQLAIGVTAKALMGYEGGFFHNETPFELQKLPGDSLAASAINFSYAHTTTILDTEDYQAERNGQGVAFDLGLVYTLEGNNEALYDWKFGVSLIDVGFINFNQNTTAHQTNIADPLSIGTANYKDLQGLEDTDDFIEYFSYQVLGDSSASTSASSFRLGLPAAFSLQASKSLGRLFYIDAALVQGFPLGGAALQRGSTLALVPRFEHRWFEAALPVTVADWDRTRVGLSLRLGFLTVGSDHLGSIFGNQDFYGSDIYFAVKVNPFSLGKGEGRGGRSRGGASVGRSRVECYEF